MATRKRGNGEGSITQSANGLWQARLTLADGRRKALYGKTRQEAAYKLTAALRDRDRGVLVVAEKQTAGHYLASWLETMKPTVRPRTWRRYGEYVAHITPAVGKVPLAKLTAQHVQALYSTKLTDGLSSTTVHHLHAVLHKALAQADRLGLVARNVCDLVDAPRMSHHEMQVLSRTQVRTLLDAAKGDRLEALYVLAVTTGMRQGELLGLRWRDIDLTSANLQVRATLQYTKDHGYSLSPPKTRQSQRRITLSSAAVDALRAHHVRQAEERLSLGPAWDDHDLVFPNTIGRPLDGKDLLRREFRPLLARTDLPRIRFHDLRHTAATLLLGQGINPKIVSEMLGHATISITLDTYSHVLPDM